MGASQLKLHFIVIILGFTGVLGALIDLPSIPLVWWRTGIAFLSILLIVAITSKSLLIPKKALFSFLGTGLIVVAHWITFFESIKISTVSVALACFASTTLFVALLEPLIFKRKILLHEVLFGLVVIGGLTMIVAFESKYLLGITYGISCAIFCALFGVLNGKFVEKHSATTITLYEMLGGFVGISVYLLLSDDFTKETFSLSSLDWLWLVLLSTVCTAYAFIAAVEVMKVLSPYTVAMTINLEPIYAILLALLIFGEKERMTTGFYFGTGVILLTVFANSWFKNRKSANS